MADLTVSEAIERLRKERDEDLRIMENAKIDAQRKEAAISVLQRMVSADDGTTVSLPDETPPLLGIAAVRAVIREEPNRVWTPREVHTVLEDRGWLSHEAQHPVAGTEAAVARLLRKGDIVRVGRGRYRWAGQEALSEN